MDSIPKETVEALIGIFEDHKEVVLDSEQDFKELIGQFIDQLLSHLMEETGKEKIATND